MTAAVERLCVFASPRADDAKGATVQLLREAGVSLWIWPPAEPQTPPPAAFDALVMLDTGTDLPPAAQASLGALLRQAWRQGATIGLFGNAATLLESADIVAGGTPFEAAGLFCNAEPPGPGAVEELIESMSLGPHTER
jgi:hypothetical protein